MAEWITLIAIVMVMTAYGYRKRIESWWRSQYRCPYSKHRMVAAGPARTRATLRYCLDCPAIEQLPALDVDEIDLEPLAIRTVPEETDFEVLTIGTWRDTPEVDGRWKFSRA